MPGSIWSFPRLNHSGEAIADFTHFKLVLNHSPQICDLRIPETPVVLDGVCGEVVTRPIGDARTCQPQIVVCASNHRGIVRHCFSGLFHKQTVLGNIQRDDKSVGRPVPLLILPAGGDQMKTIPNQATFLQTPREVDRGFVGWNILI